MIKIAVNCTAIVQNSKKLSALSDTPNLLGTYWLDSTKETKKPTEKNITRDWYSKTRKREVLKDRPSASVESGFLYQMESWMYLTIIPPNTLWEIKYTTEAMM
eukprot:Platyproteum_vivax@DN1870_c0_g1_i1.p2